MGVSAHVPNPVDSVEDLRLLDDMENENTNPLREVNTDYLVLSSSFLNSNIAN